MESVAVEIDKEIDLFLPWLAELVSSLLRGSSAAWRFLSVNTARSDALISRRKGERILKPDRILTLNKNATCLSVGRLVHSYRHLIPSPLGGLVRRGIV